MCFLDKDWNEINMIIRHGFWVCWISVKDEIPSNDRRVLGTDGKKHEIVCCINSECEWVGATSDYGILMSLDKVTHWMPLPSPPKDEDIYDKGSCDNIMC